MTNFFCFVFFSRLSCVLRNSWSLPRIRSAKESILTLFTIPLMSFFKCFVIPVSVHFSSQDINSSMTSCSQFHVIL